MFENFKTGNIVKKLGRIYYYNDKLKQYNKTIADFIPQFKTKMGILAYYELQSNNIVYQLGDGLLAGLNITIKAENIIILKVMRNYNGDFIYKINHKLSKKILSQIKDDSKIIDKYIKNIENYMKNNLAIEDRKHYKEQQELERMFCK